MKRRSIWPSIWTMVIIGWLFGFFGKAAHADEMQQEVVLGFEPGTLAKGTPMPDEMVLDYLQYVLDLTRYDSLQIQALPKVIMVDSNEFVNEVCPKDEPRHTDCGNQLLGVYVFADENAVYVRANAEELWYASLPSVVVHELTHWVQHLTPDMNTSKQSCGDAAARELEARTAGYMYDHLIKHRDYPFTLSDLFTPCIMANLTPTPKPLPGEKIGVIGPAVITVAPSE